MHNMALVIGDMQNGIFGNFGNDLALMARTRAAIDASRAAGLPVVFVRVGFRAGHPDISPHNQMFSGVAKAGAMLATDAITQLHDGLGVKNGDIVVIKRRVGAFHGTDLDLVLRAQGVTGFAIGGIATSGVVLSSVRHGADLDYRITVLADLCKDADQEVHDVLLSKVFPRQAAVMTAEAWAGTLAS